MAVSKSVFVLLVVELGLIVGAVAQWGSQDYGSSSYLTVEIPTEPPDEVSTIIATTLETFTIETSELPDKDISNLATLGLQDEGAITATIGLPDEIRITATSNMPDDNVTPARTGLPVISLIKAKSSVLVISWEQDPSAKEYYIRYYPKYGRRNIQLEHVHAPVNHAKLHDLEPNTVYIIEVEVKNSSSLYSTLGTAEMETLRASSSSNVETALIYISCVFAFIIILLLIILCCMSCRLKRTKPVTIEDPRNGDVKLRNKSLEHHNPGYQPTEDKDDEEDKITSHAYIYITPENSPVSSPIGLFPDLKQ